MKSIGWFAAGMLVLLAAGSCPAAEAPHGLAGFVLGRPLAEFKDRVIMDTAMPVRYSETFHEVEIRPTEGYKSGLIGFGTCDRDGHIVRIKLKYADSSKKFYTTLLEKFKQRFGEPTEYNGDPFQVFISWKWSFTDRDGQRISLILQHNVADEDEKMGNAVKLTSSSLVDQELACFKKLNADERQRLREMPPIKLDAEGWERFVPK